MSVSLDLATKLSPHKNRVGIESMAFGMVMVHSPSTECASWLDGEENRRSDDVMTK